MGRLRGPSVIQYTGTGARAISCNTAGNLGFYNLHILHTNSGFTGHVIDFSNAFLCVVSDCYFGSNAASNATSLIYLPNAYTMVIARNNFAHCQTAIVGRLSNEHFSNAIPQNTGINLGTNVATGVVISGNKFDGVTTPIANLPVAHQNVTISGNHPSTVTDVVRSGLITLEGTTHHRFPSDGTVAVAKFAGGLEVHVRPDAGKRALLTFTEDTIADRWVVGTRAADANLYFGTGNSTSDTDRVIVRSDGGVTMTGTPRFNASNTTGAGSASLGANCPAAILGAPYRWIGITTADGSTAYVPCWK